MSVFESFQTNRLTDRLHAVVQFVLVFLVLAAVNFIGMESYRRFDLTVGRDYTLSAETVAYLRQLEEPVEVYVTISEREEDVALRDILKDVKRLLREYEYATSNQIANRIRVEYLDIYQQSRLAKELGIEQANAVVFSSGGRKQVVFIDELYEIENKEITEFLGERVFTRSIVELSNQENPMLYFTRGHGELALDDFSALHGASTLADELTRRNLEVRSIDLASLSSVPDDASLVVIAGPKREFLLQEVAALKDYLSKRSGRILILLEPGADHGLEDLLFDWGILADDVIVIERDRNFLINGGDMMIKRFAEHPITNDFYSLGLTLITDRARSVRADPGRPVDDSLIVTDLMETSPKSWGERRYGPADDPPEYDPDVDLAPPVRLGAVSERKVDSSLGISLPGGRVVAIGTASFVSNNRLPASGNHYLIKNAINYLIDREAQLNIPPRPIRRVKLDLSMEQLLVARYLIWLAPPAMVGLLGLAVFLVRRQ